MRNKALAIAASILLSAGIAFALVGSNQACCSAAATNNQATQTCCDMSACSQEDCPIPCCEN